MKKKSLSDVVGIYNSNSYGKFEVVDYINSKDVRIIFLETGTKRVTSLCSIKSGSVRDPYYPIVFGVGFKGEGQFTGREYLKCYHCWWDMLDRCYNTKQKRYHRYGGRGTTVCKQWHNYHCFALWYYDNIVEGFHLDKDILGAGHLYSPECCCFIPLTLNNLLVSNNKNRGEYPVGVCWDKGKGKFLASMSSDNFSSGSGFIGRYASSDEAFKAYKSAKELVIKGEALIYLNADSISEEVYNSLLSIEIVPYPK